MMDVHPTDIFMYAIGDIEISKNSIIVTFNQDFYKKLEVLNLIILIICISF